jgi:hypothetical protein
MQPEGVFPQVEEGGTLDTAGGSLEAPLNNFSGKAEGLEDLGALVTRQGADAHLGKNLGDTNGCECCNWLL